MGCDRIDVLGEQLGRLARAPAQGEGDNRRLVHPEFSGDISQIEASAPMAGQ